MQFKMLNASDTHYLHTIDSRSIGLTDCFCFRPILAVTKLRLFSSDIFMDYGRRSTHCGFVQSNSFNTVILPGANIHF